MLTIVLGTSFGDVMAAIVAGVGFIVILLGMIYFRDWMNEKLNK